MVRTHRLAGVLLAGALLLGACGQADQLQEISGQTMGTTWSAQFVVTADTDTDGLREDLEAALETVNAQMSTYREDSHLSRFNQSAAGESLELPPEFTVVLMAALELAEATDGAFDPTVGPLVNLWGFGPDGRRTEAPPEEELEAARERVGWQQLEFDMNTRRLTQPGEVYLDLSSIAKGFAADQLAEVLEGRGIDRYLVGIGGDMRIRGDKPGGAPWRIAIERPDPGARDIHTVIEPVDVAMATSGSYRNFFVDGEQEYSHTIDPHTGRPVPQDLVSVTVLHDNAKMADGLATAITALGAEAGYRFAREQGLTALLLVRDNDDVRERMTPEFAAYLPQEDD
nr:FAD:protein FMN transferase [Methylonatrum kenyense]